jgi:hypothetical protein
MIFLAVAGLAAAYPHAFAIGRRDARARLGRAAVVAALTAISAAILFRVVEQAISLRFPAAASLRGFNAPDVVGLPFPALLGILSTITRTLAFCAVAGLFILALQGFRARAWLPSFVGTLAVFLAALEPGANARQMPLMLASSAAVALLAYVIVRYVLGANLLAWPLTIAVALLAGNGSDLLQHHRADLTINGIVQLAVAAGLLVWAGLRGELVIPAVDHE